MSERLSERIWKCIPDFSAYAVSNYGEVRNNLTDYILKPFIRGKYPCVELYGVRNKKQVYIHLLVARAFIGVKPEGHQVNHKDGNKNNNRIENLEYVTPSTNMFHSSMFGLAVTGERHYCHKLTEAKVLEIRDRYKEGNVTVRALAREYGVTQRTMQQVIEKSTWRFIKRAGGE